MTGQASASRGLRFKHKAPPHSHSELREALAGSGDRFRGKPPVCREQPRSGHWFRGDSRAQVRAQIRSRVRRQRVKLINQDGSANCLKPGSGKTRAVEVSEGGQALNIGTDGIDLVGQFLIVWAVWAWGHRGISFLHSLLTKEVAALVKLPQFRGGYQRLVVKS